MAFLRINSTTLTSTATFITFDGIPSTVSGIAIRDLAIVAIVPQNTTSSAPYFQINDNANQVYGNVGLWAQPGSTNTFYTNYSFSQFGGFPTSDSNQYFMRFDFLDFNQTDKNKMIIGKYASATGSILIHAGTRFDSTAAITKIRFGESGLTYPIGTQITLYGVAA